MKPEYNKCKNCGKLKEQELQNQEVRSTRTIFIVLMIIVTLVFFVSKTFSQSYQQQNRRIAAYNVLFGGVVGGIGNCIHNKEEEKIHKRFARGFWMGSIGGAVNFTGKKLSQNIYRKESYAWCWPSKIVHSTGTSIIENAIMNRKLYQAFSIDYGFIRFDADFIENDYKVRGMPFAFGGVMRLSFTKTIKFDFGKTLAVGSPVFTKNEQNLIAGYSYFNNIVLNEYHGKNHWTINHELVHIFQTQQHLTMNDFVTFDRIKVVSKYVYFDIPYHLLTYRMFPNWFEFEAYSIAQKKP